MDWLQRFLLTDAPPNTTLQGAELSFRGLLPLWLAALVFLGSAAGAFFLYLREGGRLSLVRRCAMACLRAALVGVVLLLLLRPVLLAEFKGQRPRPVVVLLDNTQSMKQQDRRLSVADQVRAAMGRGQVPFDARLLDLTALPALPPGPAPERVELVRSVLNNDRLRLLDGLGERGPLQPFLAGARPRWPAGDAPLAEQLTAIEPVSALADSIQDVLARADDPPAAIVLVTDGRDNASKLTLTEAGQLCRDRGVPLHIWGVGSSTGGILQLKDVAMPGTIFIDSRPDARDDPVQVPLSWRCRGFRQGTVLVTLRLGGQVIRKEFPVREGEDIRETITFTPDKGPEGTRDFTATVELKDDETTRDQVQRTVQVKNSKVKVLVIENLPRREYKFLEPVLERDRRVLVRFFLAEGDPKLAQGQPDPESGAWFLDAFPENFPDPSPRDPDPRPFDVLILGDVPPRALGPQGPEAIRKFVREGGGLVVIAGRWHMPGEYGSTPLEEVLPVEFARKEFPIDPSARTQAFRPVLTHDGEHSPLLALADTDAENLRLWKEDLWKDAQGFHWHYPVTGLRPGATALLVHPDQKTTGLADPEPMPLFAGRYYGKGEVLFLGTDETWRWRHNTGDRLTARFWGQIVARLGLPHLLGGPPRAQLELEQAEAILGRPGGVRARLLDEKFNPLTEPTVSATLTYLDGPEASKRTRPVELRRVPGLRGDYRASLPNDAPGRFELRLDRSPSGESVPLVYRVEVPPRHELEVAGMDEETLRTAAQVSGGAFYREEDLPGLAASIQPQKVAFVQRQEILLWNPLALLVFVGLLTAEWLLRKFSNLS